jgi:DNA-binding IclR family transcriptional regulator
MVLTRENTAKIIDILKENPQGLSITGILKEIGINRNTAGRYLETLLVSGQVEMRHFGMAKIYALSNRVPQSAMLSISSDLVLSWTAACALFLSMSLS